MKSLDYSNVRLTGNIKIVVDDNKIFLDTIPTNSVLKRSELNNITYSTQRTYGENLYNLTSKINIKSNFYDVVKENDLISNDISKEFISLYNHGLKRDNTNYVSKSHRFFTTVLLDNTNIADAFVICKGGFVNNKIQIDKIVSIQDLHTNGVYDVLKNHQSNIYSNDVGLYVNFESGITVNGIDINSGINNSKFDADVLSYYGNERTITEFNNNVTNLYRKHNLIDGRYLNIEYCVDLESDVFEINDYIGFYVTYDESTNIDSLPRITDIGNIIQPKTNYTPIKYDKLITKIKAVESGTEYKYVDYLQFKSIPNKGSYINILSGDDIIKHIVIDNIDSLSKENTINNIIQTLNNSFAEIQRIVLTAKNSDGNIIITITDSDLSNIKLESDILGLTHYDKFRNIDKNCIFFNKKEKLFDFDFIKYDGNTLSVVDRYEYLDFYVLQTNIEQRNIFNSIISFYSSVYEKIRTCKYIDHYNFDCDLHKTYYNDILDFNTEDYKNYLLDEVNKDNFYGKYNSSTDSVIVNTYKNELTSKLNQYFDSIDLNYNFLLNDIDLLTKEASNVSNEFERLSEVDTININKVVPFINKFQIRNGNNTYSKPYGLNIALPFRYDNFSPSLDINIRDIRLHTHSWYIIGEGTPPYLNDSNKIVGYSKNKITKSNILSDSIDIFEELRDYSIITKQPELKYSEVFFRGLSLFFDEKYKDYKFASILLTKDVADKVNRNIELLVNETFKSVTLLIELYIPEPILTSLERSDEHYFLDRSLLYFLENTYTTETNLANINDELISLDLFNETSTKKYNNIELNSKSWLYNDNGTNLIYVKKGFINKFKLNEIITGREFEIFIYNDNENEYLEYGMNIKFVDIVEVGEDYFWCKDILVKMKDVDNWETEDVTDDIVNNIEFSVLTKYLSDPDNIFKTDNYMRILKPLSYYNAKFNIILEHKVLISRYNSISTASIFEDIKRNLIKTTNSLGEEYKETIYTALPSKFSSLISLTNTTKLETPYIIPMIRYNGFYDPIVNEMIKFNDDNIIFNSYNKYNYKISKENLIYNKFLSNSNIRSKNKFYTKFISENTDVNISYYSNPLEISNLVSIAFSTPKEIELNYQNIDMLVNLETYSKNIIRKYIDLEKLSDVQKINFIDLENDVNLDNINNFDVNKIVSNKLSNEILKIYNIHLYDNDNNEVFYEINKNIINTDSEVSYIKLKR